MGKISKIFVLLGLFFAFVAGADAKMVEFPFVGLRLDVPQGWTSREQKETRTIELISPKKDAVLTVAKTPAEGASALEAAEYLADMHKGTKPQQVREDMYKYKFKSDGNETEVLVILVGADLLVIGLTGSHPQVTDILDSVEPIDSQNQSNSPSQPAPPAGIAYDLRNIREDGIGDLYLIENGSEKQVKYVEEVRAIKINGQNYTIVQAIDNYIDGEGESVGVMCVLKNWEKIAQIQINPFSAFGEFLFSPRKTRYVTSFGTSPVRSFTVYSLPDLKILAQDFEGYEFFNGKEGLQWDGEDKLLFDADGGYDKKTDSELMQPTMLNLKTGKFTKIAPAYSSASY